MVLHEKTVPNVIGGDELVAKQSVVNEQGKLRTQPIDGVIFRPVRPVPTKMGTLPRLLSGLARGAPRRRLVTQN